MSRPSGEASLPAQHLVGVLAGEGIGPEIVDAAIRVLKAALDEEETLELRFGGAIGRSAEEACGAPLSAEVVSFCQEIFDAGGQIVCGPAGGRFVYDLRKRFDLYYKLVPLWPVAEGALRPERLDGVDLLLVRDNVEGVYQGAWRTIEGNGSGGRRAEHSFSYSEAGVRRLLDVAARRAAARRGKLAITIKPEGLPSISALWVECARGAAEKHGVELTALNIDLAAYLLLERPGDLDVIAASNLFGDILGDLGALLIGGRGLSHSANFSASGAGVFQTGHGAAYDLRRTDVANPIGQILSVAMMLRESFGRDAAARSVESAVSSVLAAGYRTRDLAGASAKVIGTREMGELIADAVAGQRPNRAAADRAREECRDPARAAP